MTCRAPDPVIPPKELLYRRLREEHVDGDSVLPEAIDLQGTSCDRSQYTTPEALVSSDWPHVGKTSGEVLPMNVLPDGEKAPWEFFAVDDPFEANQAHCEIRVRRHARRPNPENDKKARERCSAVRESLKYVLAQSFRVWDPKGPPPQLAPAT